MGRAVRWEPVSVSGGRLPPLAAGSTAEAGHGRVQASLATGHVSREGVRYTMPEATPADGKVTDSHPVTIHFEYGTDIGVC